MNLQTSRKKEFILQLYGCYRLQLRDYCYSNCSLEIKSLITNRPSVSEIHHQLIIPSDGDLQIFATSALYLPAVVGIVVFGIFVVVVLQSAFAMLQFVVVLVVVELQMLGLVHPSPVQRGVWLSLLLKLLRPIFLSYSSLK
jgi:hypothetical protein